MGLLDQFVTFDHGYGMPSPAGSGFDPTMASIGLLGLAGTFGRPKYSTNIADVTGPDNTGFNNALQMGMLSNQYRRTNLLAQQQAQEAKMKELQLEKARREQMLQDQFTKSLPATMPADQRAAAALNPSAYYQNQYGSVLPPAAEEQRRRMALPQALPPDVEEQRRRMEIPQILPADVEAQRIRMAAAGQVLPDAAVQQKILIANASREPRLLSPEEEAQKVRLAQATVETKPPTEAQANASGYAQRMLESEKVMQGFADKGYYGRGSDAVMAKIPFVGNLATSNDYQALQQAQRDWVRAKLRKESGATITDPEMESEIKTYFPQPGDSADVVKQKAASRSVAVKSMMESAGRALPAQKGAPKRGDIEDGWEFLGGDPGNRLNWRRKE